MESPGLGQHRPLAGEEGFTYGSDTEKNGGVERAYLGFFFWHSASSCQIGLVTYQHLHRRAVGITLYVSCEVLLHRKANNINTNFLQPV